ncbi:MAG: hypothetical protein CMJ83_18080 [Planctomycetes bacterium]|nr:hypothetical protein [Planctomycetota bacterium]
MVQIAETRLRERRREILETASLVFREKGFHGAGMRDIASALGIAVGKLYYWFESKQALLAFCQEDCLTGLLRMAERVESRIDDPADRLWHLVVGHVRCLNESTPGSLAHLEVESLEEPHRSRILRLRDRYERRLRSAVSAGVRSGALRTVDAHVTALAILGAANWSVKWYRPGGRLPLRRIAASFADQLIRGVLAAPEDFQTPTDDSVSAPETTDDT